DKELFAKQVHHFNIFMQGFYENIMRSVSRYKEFGSFDLFMGWRNLSMSHYFNSTLPMGTEDLKSVIETAKSHGPNCSCTVEKMLEEQEKSLFAAGDRLAKEMYEYVERTGNY